MCKIYVILSEEGIVGRRSWTLEIAESAISARTTSRPAMEEWLLVDLLERRRSRCARFA